MTKETYGNWSNEFGLNIVSDEKWRRRRDLMGINLRPVNVLFSWFYPNTILISSKF
jgi:hypothetical protein